MVFALAASLLLTSCGYRMVSAPDGSERVSVAVPLFDNRTFEPFLNARVTERVKARLISSGPWRLVNRPERAALVIRGAVTGFGVTTVSFDAANRPLEQRVSITADLTAEPNGKAPLQITLTGTAEYTETSPPPDGRVLGAAGHLAVPQPAGLEHLPPHAPRHRLRHHRRLRARPVRHRSE